MNNSIAAERPNTDPGVAWDLNVDRLLAKHEQMFEDHWVIEAVLEHLKSGERLLDVGCGFGRAVSLVENTDPGRITQGQYVGIDCSQKMIEAARERHPGYDFRVGRLGALGSFDDKPFDAFLLLRVLANTPREDTVSALTDLRAQLRAGAVGAVMVDWGVTSEKVTRDDCKDFPDNYELHYTEYEVEELTDYVKQAGFKVLDAKIPCGCHFALILEAH